MSAPKFRPPRQYVLRLGDEKGYINPLALSGFTLFDTAPTTFIFKQLRLRRMEFLALPRQSKTKHWIADITIFSKEEVQVLMVCRKDVGAESI